MATLVEVLRFKYRGAVWRMENTAADSYANLTWLDAGQAPTESELRAFSAEVDALILAERRQAAAQKALINETPDALLKAIETLTAAIKEIQAKLRAAALTDTLAHTDAIDALAARLQSLRN